MPQIESFERVRSIVIDMPFTQYGDYRADGKLATSFDTIKEMVDRAIKLGFNAISFETNVPINVQTGELQLYVPGDPNNGDKTFPESIWEGISYAESNGLKTIIDLCIRNILNDVHVATNNVGKEFKDETFFNSVKNYETDIALKASLYGVDSIRISKFNFGFDSGKYLNQWSEIINSIRSVYKGNLSYQKNVEDSENVIWGLVDEIQVLISPTFSLKSDSTKADIAQMYLGSYVMGNGVVSETSIYSRIQNLISKYPNKKISAEVSFSPGQSAGHENANPWSYVFSENPLLVNAKDEKTLTPYPEKWIDAKLNQEKIMGFLEFFGNYLENDLSNVQIWQYMPWTEATWIRNPSSENVTGQVWQSITRAGAALNWQPDSEQTIASYFNQGWGFNLLHFGTDKNDTLRGSEVNDTFYVSKGADKLYGGSGIDTVIVAKEVKNFTITSTASASDGVNQNDKLIGYVVTETAKKDNTLQISEIERLKFSDNNIALDVGPAQNAGSVYMLYKAAFNRAPDAVGMGYWIAGKDGGANIVTTIAQGFVNSPEFIAKYSANPSNSSYVNNLYLNVLDRPGEAEGVAYWIGEMDAGRVSKAQALVYFATLPEGAENVAPLIANGIQYQEWVG